MDVQSFSLEYIENLKLVLDQLNHNEVAAAVDLIKASYDLGGIVCVAGNGGSASAASHFVNDLNKGVLGHHGDRKIRRFKALCLNDSTSVMTAWANDCGYDKMMSEQAKNFLDESGLIILISSSGNSDNLLEAAKVAHENGAKVLSLTAFSGGKLREVSDVNVYIPVDSYQLSEDIHVILMHVIVSYLFEELGEHREAAGVKARESVNVAVEI
jgi:D-sedoheptulose 7-phosphate isomerase